MIDKKNFTDDLTDVKKYDRITAIIIFYFKRRII